MKKQSLILWIGSIVIVFVIAYLNKITSAEYPVTGTIGIEGKKVTYRLEKVHYGNDNYTFQIRTDLDSLEGKYFYKVKDQENWEAKRLIRKDFLLFGAIPMQKPESTIQYYIELNYHNKNTIVPDLNKVKLTFFGKIPIVIDVLQFMLLYFGLVLAVRAGLESFNENIKTKKFAVLVLIIFLTLNALINPLYLTYKFGFINNSIPSIERLINPIDMIIFALWIITAIVLFNKPNYKFVSLFSAAITLIVFIFFS